MPYDETTLLVVDVRCLEKPTTASSIRPQGWAILPVFVDRVVDSGLHQLPLFGGTPDNESLSAISKAASKSAGEWQRELGRIARERGLGIVSGGSVTVTLLDAQRYNEYERPEKRRRRPCPTACGCRSSSSRRTCATCRRASHSSLVGKIRGELPPEQAAAQQGGGGGFFGGVGAAVTGNKAPYLTQEELQAESLTAFKQAMGLL